MVIDKKPDVNTPKVVFLGGKFLLKFLQPKLYNADLVVHAGMAKSPDKSLQIPDPVSF